MWVGGLSDAISTLVGEAIMPVLTRADGSLIREWIIQVIFAKIFRRTFASGVAGAN